MDADDRAADTKIDDHTVSAYFGSHVVCADGGMLSVRQVQLIFCAGGENAALRGSCNRLFAQTAARAILQGRFHIKKEGGFQ